MYRKTELISNFMSFLCFLITAFATDTEIDQTKEQTGMEPDRRSIWQLHWPFFLVVIVLLAVSIVLGILLCLCLKVCKKRQTLKIEKMPIESVAAAPGQTQASVGIREDNGWIIPLDQITPEE